MKRRPVSNLESAQKVSYVGEQPGSTSQAPSQIIVSKRNACTVVLLIVLLLVAVIVQAAMLGTRTHGSSGSDINEGELCLSR